SGQPRRKSFVPQQADQPQAGDQETERIARRRDDQQQAGGGEQVVAISPAGQGDQRAQPARQARRGGAIFQAAFQPGRNLADGQNGEEFHAAQRKQFQQQPTGQGAGQPA